MGDTAVLDGSEVEITELEKIEADRVDGVGSPANGIPFLMLKSLPGPGPAVKGSRDCPKCDKSYDADHKGSSCENCGTKLPDGDAAKASEPKCKTCNDTGTIMDGNRDCPDCDAKPSAAKAAAAAIAKAADADGMIDEGPDVDLGQQIMGLLAQAIINEAQEIKAGVYSESVDVELLTHAASMIQAWLTRETSDGAEMGVLMCAAMKDSRTFSTDERKKQADQGNALPDGSYPIPDADALKRAATLAQSKHGDWQAAEKLIARRAKELGVANPLADGKDDTSKSAVAEGEADVQTDAQGTGGLSKAVEDAVTKAMAPLQERIKSLDAELAKVKALPVPGGLALSRNVQVKDPRGEVSEDWAAKAAHYRDLAETVTDRGTADGYRKLAREADAKATAPAAT